MVRPQSVRLSFQLNNKDGAADHQLRTIGGAYSFFSRVRLLCCGAMVEDLMDYSRMHNMFQNCQALTLNEMKILKDLELMEAV